MPKSLTALKRLAEEAKNPVNEIHAEVIAIQARVTELQAELQALEVGDISNADLLDRLHGDVDYRAADFGERKLTAYIASHSKVIPRHCNLPMGLFFETRREGGTLVRSFDENALAWLHRDKIKAELTKAVEAMDRPEAVPLAQREARQADILAELEKLNTRAMQVEELLTANSLPGVLNG